MRKGLRQIATHQVRLGMFIERLEGNWLDHPFWRKRFLIEAPADLARLRASAVAAVTIDEAKGVPLADDADAAPAAASPPQRRRLSLPRLALSPMDRERARAERVIQQSRRSIARMFGEVRLGRAMPLQRALPIVDEIVGSIDGNVTALFELTRLKSVDSYTYLHSIAVSGLMIAFARHLALDEDEVRLLGLAGLLHDIGKMAIPRAVLQKPANLSPAEVALIQTHPERGHAILLARPDTPELVLDVCLHHHERMNGGGYPGRLAGEGLSRAARIAAICDVYDAVTSVRPYKKPWAPVEALTQMARWDGHFDRALLERFVAALGFEDQRDRVLEQGAEPAQQEVSVNGFSDPSA
ncbi:cyclic di-GMP phosphodiesterase [Aureimonas endophytica]|uniref:Cyclic di-GMP phosphodiesterase n=1 Tax=Aureimonas endophytica TaxID=2027858 RepID=A0A917EE84_9HYPH|nr:HD-GYP domain-containing protein [Aureimonas endophytica]GGE23278.1 cyclic di-GMP phosphodiesterase [Aureimonas endophytica]